ncbi:MAG: hypothetical protein Q9214_005990, partial [Letrouitia sp. 1 TL-2023]
MEMDMSNTNALNDFFLNGPDAYKYSWWADDENLDWENSGTMIDYKGMNSTFGSMNSTTSLNSTSLPSSSNFTASPRVKLSSSQKNSTAILPMEGSSRVKALK